MKIFKHLLICAAIIALSLLTLAACGEHECEWGEWTALEGEAATCTEGGKEIRVCLGDSTHTDTRDVDPLGHKFEGGGDSGECERCGFRTNEHILTDKNVIFIGNSHTYFGGTVNEVSPSMMDLIYREGDRGYFYRLCKANEVFNITVTNWTFGNHSLKDLFSGDCQANRSCGNGADHLSCLTKNNYDYVIFQNGSTDGNAIMEWIDVMMDYFKEGNPDTKFVMLVQARAHNDHASDPEKYTWLSKLSEIEQKGVTIVDWGALVYDLYSGAVELPGEDTLPLDKNSFVIAKSETDGYHPNLLAGYVTTLMTYCAITGESAVGQEYAFCSTTRSFASFIKSYYKVGETNFTEVFESEATMRAIQQLVDEYLAAKGYRNYE